MEVSLNLREIKKMLIKKSLYDFIKEFWDAYETDKFVDHWLIEFQSECFMYSVKHFLPAYIWSSWIDDATYENLKKKHNAVCPVRDKLYNGEHVRNHDWNMPPRHMKSSIMNVCGPVWLAINCPIKVASVSHSAPLSSEMNIKRQKLLESDKYKYYFWEDKDCRLRRSSATMIRLYNGSQLYSVCQTSFTGFGADVIIADDLISSMNAQKDGKVLSDAIRFFRKTLPTRLNGKKGVVWQIQQRLAMGDISGNILKDKGLIQRYSHTELCAEASKDITLIYPCTGKIKVIKKGDLLWEERFGDYSGIKLDVGIDEFETQYNQNPKNSNLNIIKDNMIHFVDDKEAREFKLNCETHYGSHDCAIWDKETSDFHGYCEGYGNSGELIISGAWEKRLGYVEEKQLLQSLHDVYPDMSQIVENKANGSPLLQDLKKDVPGLIDFDPRSRDKAARLKLASIYMKNGSVRFEQNEETEYLIERLKEYPLVEHDDIIDAFSQMVISHFIQERIGVYTKAFTFKNVIDDVVRQQNEQVFYEFAANMCGNDIRVVACSHDLAEDTFTFEKEWIFKNLQDFENFCQENARFGNLFIDASIQNRLKFVILNSIVYLTPFVDEDKDASISLLRTGFYKGKIRVCKSCTNTRTDIARLKFTGDSVNEGTNKLTTLDEGFAGCVRAIVTYDKGVGTMWY